MVDEEKGEISVNLDGMLIIASSRPFVGDGIYNHTLRWDTLKSESQQGCMVRVTLTKSNRDGIGCEIHGGLCILDTYPVNAS